MARDTLLKAVASIAKYYASKPTLLHSFYRETIRQQPTDQYVLYTEGIIDVYKPSYFSLKRTTRYALLKVGVNR